MPDAGGDIRTTDATDASCDVTKEATTSTLISQDIFGPEDSGVPSPETIQEGAPLPSQEKTVVSPSFDMFAPSQETEIERGAVVESAASGRQVPGSVVDASVLLDKRDAAGLKPTEESETGDDAMETSDVGQDSNVESGECAKVDEMEGSVTAKIGSKLCSRTTSFMSVESGSDEDGEGGDRGKGKEIVEKGKQVFDPMTDSSNDDEEGSVSSDLNKSATSALKTPDVPRLVVPGLLGAVLQKFGQKPDQAARKPTKTTAPLQKGKKVKVAKKSVTPKKFPKLARVGSTSAGKVVKRRAPNSMKNSNLKKPLAWRSKVASKSKVANSRNRQQQQQVSTASALLALQKRRTAGTWVRCTIQECGKWRKLQEMDPSQVKTCAQISFFRNLFI